MNPLVADMLDLVSLGDIKCESPTHDFGRVKCSGDVAYVIVACEGGTARVCTALGKRAIYMRDHEYKCGYCYVEKIRDCWTIRPWG